MEDSNLSRSLKDLILTRLQINTQRSLSTQNKLVSLITVGLETLVVEISDYCGNEKYNNHIFVRCDNQGLVLGKDLKLTGFAESAKSDLFHDDNDVIRANRLEAEYGFSKIAKAFVKGKRGMYKSVLSSEDLYDILSPHAMKYCEFVVFSHSNVSQEEIRSRLHSLIGGIICSLDEKTLRAVSHTKNGISLSRFLLVALQKNTSLYFERNPVTC